MELVMPLWAIKICKVHGPLKKSETIEKRTNPSGNNSPVCKKCRNQKRPYCPIRNKSDMQKFGKKRLDAKLQKTYRITLEQYNSLLQSQNFLCAICKTHRDFMDKKKGIKRSLAVDHCHLTGKVRGLLCHRCNTAIGLFHESFTTVENALNYLRHHKSGAK
jgi:hypothetical protein